MAKVRLLSLLFAVFRQPSLQYLGIDECSSMALFGPLSVIRTQIAGLDHFQAAFHCVENCLKIGTHEYEQLRAITVGGSERVELGGGTFALLQAYISKLREETFFESHKRYIDVQVIAEGDEIIETVDIGKLTLKEDFTPGRDLVAYEMFKEASGLRMKPGNLAIFFPQDGHMSIAANDKSFVRKIVVKVPVF